MNRASMISRYGRNLYSGKSEGLIFYNVPQKNSDVSFLKREILDEIFYPQCFEEI